MDDYLDTFIYPKSYVYCISDRTYNGSGYGDDHDCADGSGGGWGDGEGDTGDGSGSGGPSMLNENIRISING
jgi:hypothetical protein